MERRTRSYLQLSKPGITLSNTMMALAGYFLAAAQTGFDWSALLGVTLGVAAIIASACVVNNILDRDIDARMKRTAKRALVRGEISIPMALLFAIGLAAVGFFSLLAWTNYLTVGLGVLAYVWYIAVYGIAKRTTAYSTIIGGVAGSLPPVAGYTALTGQIDSAAIILFLLMQLWQMPHFFAIAIFRANDYVEAKLPIWSVRYGLKRTKRQVLVYAILFAFTAPLLTIYGYTGYIFGISLTSLGIYWVYKGVSSYDKNNDALWAKRMFGLSLMILLLMAGLIAVGAYLP